MEGSKKTVRPLSELPPLQFPIPSDVWEKFKPSYEEYHSMITAFFKQENFTEFSQFDQPDQESESKPEWDYNDNNFEYF